MTDTPTPGTETATPPPASSSNPLEFLAVLAGFAAMIGWVVAWLQARSAWAGVDGTFGASAPQISQISDEAQLELMQYWALAGGLTVLAILLALGAIAGRVSE